MQRETATGQAAAPTAAAPAPDSAARESATATGTAAAPTAAPSPDTTTNPRHNAKRPLPQPAPQGRTSTAEPFVYDGASTKVPKTVQHVRIGKTVKEIPMAAFMDCKDLERVECNDCLEDIGEDAFYGCESLKTVDKLPGTLERIGDFAFSHCFKLETAIFAKGIERIPMQAFLHCYALKDIGKLLSKTKVIGVEAFRDCDSLPNVKLEEGLERIERGAFFHCIKLQNQRVPIPSTVNCIQDFALDFDGFSTIESHESHDDESERILEANMRRICFDDNIKHIVFQPEKGKKSKLEAIEWNDQIESIGKNAFYECRLLEDAGEFPPTLKVIKRGAFMYCEKLARADFEEGVEEIGDYAFAHCSSLRDVGNLFSTVQKIGDFAFAGCEALFSEQVIEYNGKNKLPKETKHLRIAENVLEIENQAFSELRKLETIEWKGRVYRIGSEAFKPCLSLRDIGKLPSTRKVIEYNGKYMVGLEALKQSSLRDTGKLPSTRKVIEYNQKNRLPRETRHVRIAENVWEIENNAFAWLTKLETIEWNDRVRRIGSNAFRRCLSLRDIGKLPSTIKEIGHSAFKDCLNLQTAFFGTGIGKIGAEAFYGCQSLMSIGKLLSTVKVIEREAFRGCDSLQHEIILPSSMTTFGPRVFNDCTKLQSIDMKEDFNVGLAMTLAAQYHHKTPNISMERLVLMYLREKPQVSQCELKFALSDGSLLRNVSWERFVFMYSREKPSGQEVDKPKEIFLAACPIEKVTEVKNACLERIESIRRLVLWRLSNGPSLAFRIKDGQDVDANDRDERKMKKEANNEERCKRALAHSESTDTAKVEKETENHLVTLVNGKGHLVELNLGAVASKGHLVELNLGAVASAEANKNLAEIICGALIVSGGRDSDERDLAQLLLGDSSESDDE